MEVKSTDDELMKELSKFILESKFQIAAQRIQISALTELLIVNNMLKEDEITEYYKDVIDGLDKISVNAKFVKYLNHYLGI
ncbi:hypothetical protein ACWV26_06725 [Rummeliibacillus sp. JY-2-4R]